MGKHSSKEKSDKKEKKEKKDKKDKSSKHDKEDKKKRKHTETNDDTVAQKKVEDGFDNQDTVLSRTERPKEEEIENFVKDAEVSYEPESAKKEFPPVLSFKELQLKPSLEKYLSKFAKPTPIQSASIPVMLENRDVVGIAETGSGKTVAFGVPAISYAVAQGKKNQVQVLVIAPTRELAMQTQDHLKDLGASLGVNSIVLYGGVSKEAQMRDLAKNHYQVVVGTPGRLLDLLNDQALDLSNVGWLVLDEADRMLDKGFENDVRTLAEACMPKSKRITCMFSATWPLVVRKLASEFMKDPVKITIGSDELTANTRVTQTTIVTTPREKEQLLFSTLKKHNFYPNKKLNNNPNCPKALVFALYKKEASRLESYIARAGYNVRGIHGDISQDKRTWALDEFKKGAADILVATDVAARGLDIPKVQLVVNVTFPLTIEDYIHRIGRTGRAGQTGDAVTFFTEEDKVHAGELMRVLREGNQKIPDGLDQWGAAIKKKSHSLYGDFYRGDIKGTAKKIKFD